MILVRIKPAVIISVGIFLVQCHASLANGDGNCLNPIGDLPFVMAYRGASAELPEHSVGAYRTAILQGARFIECDVVLTADLVPLCRHEPNIAATTDVLTVPEVLARARAQQRRRNRLLRLRVMAAAAAAAGGGSAPAADMGPQESDPAGDPAAAVEDAEIEVVLEEEENAVGGSRQPVTVLAADLTLADIKRLRAVFPDEGGGGPGTAGPASRAREPESSPGEDLRVATLEELLQMASAVEPAVGVAVHIQGAAWHNSDLPQLRAANTTFEDILLGLLRKYDYAAGPYGSDAWRRRPSYLMAFEAGSLRYLAQRTDSPLTQVLGPTIPDTGETWDSATSAEGLARIQSYADSVAVARQQLLAAVTAAAAAASAASPGGGAGVEEAAAGAAVMKGTLASGGGAAGGGGGGAARAGGLVASEPLFRMRQAGLQVFASVFKPRPAGHLLPGAETWADEVAPLVLGLTGSPGGKSARGGAEGQGRGGGSREGGGAGTGSRDGSGAAAAAVGARRGGAAAIDGLFTDSPAEMHRLLAGLRCASRIGEGERASRVGEGEVTSRGSEGEESSRTSEGDVIGACGSGSGSMSEGCGGGRRGAARGHQEL